MVKVFQDGTNFHIAWPGEPREIASWPQFKTEEAARDNFMCYAEHKGFVPEFTDDFSEVTINDLR